MVTRCERCGRRAKVRLTITKGGLERDFSLCRVDAFMQAERAVDRGYADLAMVAPLGGSGV